MFKKLALSTAMAVVLAAPAFAQTTAPTAMPKTITTSPAPNSSQIDAQKLIGESIQNVADNATIGKVDSVILNSSGKVDKVVVGVGGFLGIGKKDVAVNWSDLQVKDNGKKVVMDTTKDRLKAMPEYVWPQDQKHGTVYTVGSANRVAPPTVNSGSSGTPPVSTGTGAVPR
jgi:hypothetical protein